MTLEYGDQARLAEVAGVSTQFLNDVLKGRKRCPGTLAVKLELISEEVLGQKVLASEWILAGLGLRQEGVKEHG